MPRISFFAGLLGLLLATQCLLADWLILKDGIQVHGTIIRRTDREVVLRSKDGAMLTFDLKKVADVHVNHPPQPKRSDPDHRREAEANGVFLDMLRESSRRRKTVVHSFGQGYLSIPSTFEKQSGQHTAPGQKGKLLGFFREPSSGALLSVVSGNLPFGATTFEEVKPALEFHLSRERGFTIRTFRETKVADRRTIYAEFNGQTSRGHRRFLQEWILLGPHEVYSVSLTVSETTFRGEPERYRRVLRSFKTELPAPKAPPRNPSSKN